MMYETTDVMLYKGNIANMPISGTVINGSSDKEMSYNDALNEVLNKYENVIKEHTYNDINITIYSFNEYTETMHYEHFRYYRKYDSWIAV